MRFEGDLNMVQPGVHQGLHESRICQLAAIGVQAGDHAQRFSIGDQFRQVGVERGLATGEDDMRDALIPDPVNDSFPFLKAQLRILP